MSDQGGFAPGDVVQLKSGGPRMTIVKWDDRFEGWRCEWFDDKYLPQAQIFPAVALTKA